MFEEHPAAPHSIFDPYQVRQQPQQAAQPVPPTFDYVPPPCQLQQYSAGSVEDSSLASRSLEIVGLQPWMNKRYFETIFPDIWEVRSIMVISEEKNGFMEFFSREAALKFLKTFNGMPMPNPNYRFNLKECMRKWKDEDSGYPAEILNMGMKYRALIKAAPVENGPRANVMFSIMSIDYLRVKFNGKDPVKLFGTVTVDASGQLHTVYDRRCSMDHEIIVCGEDATLTGPFIPILPNGDFAISINLSGHDSLEGDKKIVDCEILMVHRSIRKHNGYLDEGESMDVDEGEYMDEGVYLDEGEYMKEVPEEDEPSKVVVHSKYGTVEMGFTLVSKGRMAIVEVLVKGEWPKDICVYGTVLASRVIGGSKKSQILFKKPTDKEAVQLRGDGGILLTRPAMVTEAFACLEIEAELWVRPYDVSIAKGSAEFRAVVGTQSKCISGAVFGARSKRMRGGYGELELPGYGEVEVRVTCCA